MGEEEVGMTVEEVVGFLEVGIALVVGSLVGGRLGRGGVSRVYEASSHLAGHVLSGAQGHAEGDVGCMVEVGSLGDNLLDALGCSHAD